MEIVFSVKLTWVGMVDKQEGGYFLREKRGYLTYHGDFEGGGGTVIWKHAEVRDKDDGDLSQGREDGAKRRRRRRST